MVTVQQIWGSQRLTDKEGSHLAPAHTHSGVYFHSLLLSPEAYLQRWENEAGQNHDCSPLGECQCLISLQSTAYPLLHPPTCCQGGCSVTAPAGCLQKPKPLCALFCASHVQFHYLSLHAPGHQGLPYTQSLHSIAGQPRTKFLTAFGEVIHAACTKERRSIWNFFLILGPYVFVIPCSRSLLEERFDSQGSWFCFRKNSKQNYFKR